MASKSTKLLQSCRKGLFTVHDRGMYSRLRTSFQIFISTSGKVEARAEDDGFVPQVKITIWKNVYLLFYLLGLAEMSFNVIDLMTNFRVVLRVNKLFLASNYNEK